MTRVRVPEKQSALIRHNLPDLVYGANDERETCR
jgi:hypothetical protein